MKIKKSELNKIILEETKKVIVEAGGVGLDEPWGLKSISKKGFPTARRDNPLGGPAKGQDLDKYDQDKDYWRNIDITDSIFDPNEMERKFNDYDWFEKALRAPYEEFLKHIGGFNGLYRYGKYISAWVTQHINRSEDWSTEHPFEANEDVVFYALKSAGQNPEDPKWRTGLLGKFMKYVTLKLKEVVVHMGEEGNYRGAGLGWPKPDVLKNL
tara:strand:- start:732 stop:1367 length:636 start_codon:yes stop_codon:yes gene_type:complete